MIKNIKIPTKCPVYYGLIIDVYVKKCINEGDAEDVQYFHGYCDSMCYSKYCDECSINALKTAINNNL